MRILRFFLLSVFLPFSWISADETLCVSLYYPYGFVWVGPYQVVPVLTRYVLPVSLKTSRPERLTTPTPFTTSRPVTPSDPVTPSGPVTPSDPMTPSGPVTPSDPVTSGAPVTPSDPVTSQTPTTARRGDN